MTSLTISDPRQPSLSSSLWFQYDDDEDEDADTDDVDVVVAAGSIFVPSKFGSAMFLLYIS
jgi:hypothetical protein